MYSLWKESVTEEELPKRRVVPAKKKNPFEERFFFSLVLNILLVIAVVVMFIIATTSDNPNIINYENSLVNKYASWEQDLREREDRIREEEKKLGISTTEEDAYGNE